jgi:3-deoxy-D-manno-octulosonic-acid transferase/heptosyltransferase-1
MAGLADRLISTYNAHLVYTGTAGDATYIDGIISRMRCPAVNAAGNTTLKELACLISRARLCVTTDSGPMHLAVAVGTPVVALFGPTAPWRTGPYTERARIVRAQAPCSPCYKRTCDSMICMNEIGVDQVMEAAAVFMVTDGAPGT